MRAVIQRVTEASVSVDNQIVGKIGAGLAILIGVTPYHEFTTSSYVDRGRYITDLDVEARNNVCVLGLDLVKALFASNEDPLDKDGREARRWARDPLERCLFANRAPRRAERPGHHQLSRLPVWA